MAVTGESRLHIGELARRTGLNPKTIRYYEQIGLLPVPGRSPSGYCLYETEDEDRLRFIHRVQRLGFTLGEIGEVLALRDRGHAPCHYVTKRLEHRAREINNHIAELNKLKTELNELQRRARVLPAHEPPTSGYCHILESASSSEG